MNKQSCNSLEFYSFANSGKHPELTNISTTRIGGSSGGCFATLNLGLSTGDDPGTVGDNRGRLSLITGAQPEALALAGQIHGTNIAVVTAADLFSETDAMITNVPDVPLAILVADCVAVSLYDPVNTAVGIAHAGWRGTVAGIAAKTVAKMAHAYGSNPAELIAGIGPSIGPCCYEVGEEVIDRFVAEDPAVADRVLIDQKDPEKKYLDLWLANSLGLQAAGLKENNIEIANTCTACNTGEFYSHRAEAGRTGRFAGIIMIHSETKRAY